MIDIKILPLNLDDLPAVMELSKNTKEFNIGSDSPQFYGLVSLSTWLDNPNSLALSAKDGGRLVGFILGQVMLGRDGNINTSVVDKAYRHKGIGEKLQNAAEEFFASKGCNRVFSTVEENNKAMLGLKKKLGFSWGKQNYKIVDKMIEPAGRFSK